jgi:hypothetical protein
MMTFKIKRKRAHFTRYGCWAIIYCNGIEVDRLGFYGKNGRAVRCEARSWAVFKTNVIRRAQGGVA